MFEINNLDKNLGLCATSFLRTKKIDKKSKVLIIDRDGVLNEDFGYVNSFERTVLIGQTTTLLREASLRDIPIAIITNQAGVAHGFYSEEELLQFNFNLLQHLYDVYEINISMLMYCPSHPNGKITKYARSCYCRKPGTALFAYVQQALEFNAIDSVYIGDNVSDREAATKFGLSFIDYVNDKSDEKFQRWLEYGNE